PPMTAILAARTSAAAAWRTGEATPRCYTRPPFQERPMTPLPLRAALKRGALVTAANWQVVLIDFSVECLYKAVVAAAIIGGAVMVATVLGGDLETMVGGGLQQAAEIVVTSLAAAPAGLLSFVMAIAIVGFGGACLMFAVK